MATEIDFIPFSLPHFPVISSFILMATQVTLEILALIQNLPITIAQQPMMLHNSTTILLIHTLT
jgi:hypothetical protein